MFALGERGVYPSVLGMLRGLGVQGVSENGQRRAAETPSHDRTATAVSSHEVSIARIRIVKSFACPVVMRSIYYWGRRKSRWRGFST